MSTTKQVINALRQRLMNPNLSEEEADEVMRRIDTLEGRPE
jgi:hypothetical protein